MPERITKSNKNTKCKFCGGKITIGYKVKYKQSEDSKGIYYHLTCYYNWVVQRISFHKKNIKALNKSKRKFKKYEKYMLLENL